MPRIKTDASKGLTSLSSRKAESYCDILYELHQLYGPQLWTVRELLGHIDEGQAEVLDDYLAAATTHKATEDEDATRAHRYGHLFQRIRAASHQLDGWKLTREGTHTRTRTALFKVTPPPQPKLLDAPPRSRRKRSLEAEGEAGPLTTTTTDDGGRDERS